MLTNFKTQTDVERFQELLNIDTSELSIVQAEELVHDIYNMLEADEDKRNFASEWVRILANTLPAIKSSTQANGAADVAMIAYAKRFYR